LPDRSPGRLVAVLCVQSHRPGRAGQAGHLACTARFGAIGLGRGREPRCAGEHARVRLLPDAAVQPRLAVRQFATDG
jgi:hypothetical protein